MKLVDFEPYILIITIRNSLMTRLGDGRCLIPLNSCLLLVILEQRRKRPETDDGSRGRLIWYFDLGNVFEASV